MGAWIEIMIWLNSIPFSKPSHPTMGAWIEMSMVVTKGNIQSVAPHDGCVDWNTTIEPNETYEHVAPHDGCVDWNLSFKFQTPIFQRRTPRWVRGLKFLVVWPHSQISFVAPHDGCVDWNLRYNGSSETYITSHPTMGAWIEIIYMSVNSTEPSRRTPRWVRGLKLTTKGLLLN